MTANDTTEETAAEGVAVTGDTAVNTDENVAKSATDKKKTAAKQKTAAKAPVHKRRTTLIIVESPAKAHTIEKYLGAGYKVKASMGHLIDLPKSRIAIDTEHGFEPEYIVVRGRGALLKELQSDAKAASRVLLASDNDREGEAIAWHLNNAIRDKAQVPIERIVFNEITPVAIKAAVKNPGTIIESKVNAQKARRVLDRLVGYNLSPILWKKVKNGLSAGRVQSVALRLICEREEEVQNFLPEEYWSLNADFAKGRASFPAQLVLYKGQKPELKNEQAVNDIIEVIKSAPCTVTSVKESEKSVRPHPPFTTSKLQQAAANKLGFTSRKTMQVAQQLYEGVSIGSSRVGLITYMRTDSVRISDTALADVRGWIGENFPNDLPPAPIKYEVGKAAQDAHEGIRPTYVKYTPKSVEKYLTNDQFRLYSIVWEQFVSSQMKSAVVRTTSVEITAGEALFRTACSSVVEKGFYNVIHLLSSKEEKTKSLPALAQGETVKCNKFTPEQHFTQGPARYTDASMVRVLEEKGIGRPSTYAPIISVLLDRYYVTRKNKQLVPTQLGKMICKILVDSFPDVINEHFTAEVENGLDRVEQGELVWNSMIGDFYKPFKEKVDQVMETKTSVKGRFDEVTDKVCETCGRPMVKKLGRFGYFLACSGFPECKTARSIPLAKCPMPGCTGEIVERRTKAKGKPFFGCTRYPECTFLTHFRPLEGQTCPKCGWFLVEKYDKKNGSHKSCINPNCDYLHSADDAGDAVDSGGSVPKGAGSKTVA